VPADLLEARALRRGRMRVAGLGVGREVVGRIAAHLVEIRDHVRHPLQHEGHTPCALGLSLREPVPVQVEEIVIRPSAGPGLVVFGGGRLAVGRRGAPQEVLKDEAGAAVRVLGRVDDDDGFPADQIRDGIVLRRQQVPRLGHRRTGRRDLVAVHAVHKRHDNGQFLHEALGLTRSERPGIGQPPQIGLDAIEPGDPVRRRDDEVEERPAFHERA